MSRFFKTAATETKDITNEIRNWYNQKGIESALNGNVLINAESTETESDYENFDEIIFTFKEPISLETFRNFLKAAGYKLKPVYEYADVDENVEISVDGNIGMYKWRWLSNKKSNIIGEFKMKKTEAQKIVEAKLNRALDRNDAQAIREACIVLKAMENDEWQRPIPVNQLDGSQWRKVEELVKSGKSDEEIKVELKEILPGYYNDEDMQYYIDLAKETRGHSL